MTVLDLGCGTGYFTIERNGRVVTTNVQKGTLDILRQKIQVKSIKKQISLFHNIGGYYGLICATDFGGTDPPK